MTSTAGQFRLRRESTGNGSLMNDCQIAQALQHAPIVPGQAETIEDADQAARYLAICELLQRHVGEGTILDVGCGSGRLYHYLTGYAGVHPACYTGIDICENAVRTAAARFPEAGFGRRDYGHESVGSRFDCVIFNDSLHCFDDPASALDKCANKNMHACSLLIVAMPEGRHNMVSRVLAQRYHVVDEQTVRDGDSRVWILQTLRLQRLQQSC